MPILRDMDLRLRDVVSVNAGTGEIIDPINDPFVNEGDLLVDVLLNEIPHDVFGTLTQSGETASSWRWG